MLPNEEPRSPAVIPFSSFCKWQGRIPGLPEELGPLHMFVIYTSEFHDLFNHNVLSLGSDKGQINPHTLLRGPCGPQPD